jgi:hypothetical protein
VTLDLAREVAARVGALDGVAAVALGGSLARGRGDPTRMWTSASTTTGVLGAQQVPGQHREGGMVAHLPEVGAVGPRVASQRPFGLNARRKAVDRRLRRV